MDFLGSTTPSIIISGTYTAIGTTFSPLSVIIALVAVPVTFYIAYILIDFILLTVIQGKTSKLSSKIMFLDHTPFVKPYKGYNRLRSQKWNIENTLE